MRRKLRRNAVFSTSGPEEALPPVTPEQRAILAQARSCQLHTWNPKSKGFIGGKATTFTPQQAMAQLISILETGKSKKDMLTKTGPRALNGKKFAANILCILISRQNGPSLIEKYVYDQGIELTPGEFASLAIAVTEAVMGILKSSWPPADSAFESFQQAVDTAVGNILDGLGGEEGYNIEPSDFGQKIPVTGVYGEYEFDPEKLRREGEDEAIAETTEEEEEEEETLSLSPTNQRRSGRARARRKVGGGSTFAFTDDEDPSPSLIEQERAYSQDEPFAQDVQDIAEDIDRDEDRAAAITKQQKERFKARVIRSSQSKKLEALYGDWNASGDSLSKALWPFLEMQKRTLPLPSIDSFEQADSDPDQPPSLNEMMRRGGSLLLVVRANGNTQVFVPSSNSNTTLSKRGGIRKGSPTWFPIAEFITRPDLLPDAWNGNVTSLGKAYDFATRWRRQKQRYMIYPLYIYKEEWTQRSGYYERDREVKLAYVGELQPTATGSFRMFNVDQQFGAIKSRSLEAGEQARAATGEAGEGFENREPLQNRGYRKSSRKRLQRHAKRVNSRYYS